MEKEFNLYENLINKIAWSYHITTKIDFEETQAQCYLIFCESIDKYNPEKGNLYNFIYSVLTKGMNNYLKKENKWNGIDKTEIIDLPSNDINFLSFEFIEMLNSNKKPIIKQMIKIIIKEGFIKKYGELDKKLNAFGFSYTKIWKAFKETQLLLKEV